MKNGPPVQHPAAINGGKQFVGPSSDGSANQGLITDGNGSLSFTNVEGVATGFTNGSVPYAKGGSLVENNSDLFWDDGNSRLGVGTTSPEEDIHIDNGEFKVTGITDFAGYPGLIRTELDEGSLASTNEWITFDNINGTAPLTGEYGSIGTINSNPGIRIESQDRLQLLASNNTILGSGTPNGYFEVRNDTAASVATVIKGASSQTANYAELQQDDAGGTARMQAAWAAEFTDSAASTYKTRGLLKANDSNAERTALTFEADGTYARTQINDGLTFDQEVDNGNSGATATVDWIAGNKQAITLTDNVTLSFTDPPAPTNVLIRLIQDGTGGRSVIWPSSVKWSGGSEPTLSSAANAIDLVSLYFDGTDYYGTSGLDFS